MYRTALEHLITWNHNKNRKPLIVWGARQVGKTYLILELFAKEYYKDKYIYVDFKIEDEIRRFCENTANPEKIIEFISLTKGKRITSDTLLIFDEIQECPNIISSLKYFCQNFREYPVITTGSMVRVKIHRINNKRGVADKGKFLFPVGKINQLSIYPMSFDEFLMNANDLLYSKIKELYNNRQSVPEEIHHVALDYFNRYLLIGGMPEAVEYYISDNDVLGAKEIIKDIYDNYLADMELYQASPEAILRSRALFANIYKELNKENKNFSPGLVEEKSKTRDFATSVQWLTFAHVINQSYQVNEHIVSPLSKLDEGYFRLFLGDMGMFTYQSGINAASFVSNDGVNALSGIFYENYAANELVAKGIPLFYWRKGNSAELEFIVESNSKLYPIDVKKNKGVLNSLSKFKEHNSFECAIKVSNNNYGYDQEQKLLTVPFYFLPFVAADLAQGTFDI